MGTLDDAIRQHLELKKRSGASEEEVERLEHEAFGPIRREVPPPEPEPAPGPDPSAAPAGDADAGAGDAAPDEPPAAPPRAERSAYEPEREVAPSPPPPGPAISDEGPLPPATSSASEPFAAPPPPPPAAPPPAPAASRSWLEDELDEPAPPPRREDLAQPTSEFTAAEAEEATGRPPADYVAPDEEGEDLLEETPDFLQETPEHDRLWFEQRPPRDFDFDE